MWNLVTAPGDIDEDRQRDLALFDACMRAAPPESIEPPSLPYQGSWWYGWYRRVRVLIPQPVRRLARRLALAGRATQE